jgi:HAD superfamily hydrolase (TIGR01549 family)
MNTCDTLDQSALRTMFGGCRGVIFDCDGVMVDSIGNNQRFYNLMLQHKGLPPMTEEQVRYVHAHTAPEGMEYIFPKEYHGEIDQMLQAFDYRKLIPSLRMYEGFVEFLDFLRGRGIRLAVNTNRTTTMEMVLEHFDLEDYFYPVITASKAQAKPSPDGMLKILEHWGFSREEVIYIGDTYLDQLAAENAGVTFWAHQSPELKAELHLDSYPKLLACLQRLAG